MFAKSKYNGYSADGLRWYNGGGGSSGGTSVTKQEIPVELKPLATAYTNKAIGLSQQGFNPYTAQRYEDLNPTQYAGIDMTANRALGGSRTIDNAEAALNQTIAGGNTNPYLDQMVNQAQASVARNYGNSIAPELTGMGVNSGSFGNSGVEQVIRNSQQDLQKTMGDIATSMYGGAYDADRARQMQGIGMAQQFGNQAYTDASALMKAGQVMQDQNQQNRDFAYQQYEDQQNLPYKQLAAMSGVFGSNLGSSSTTTQSGGGGK